MRKCEILSGSSRYKRRSISEATRCVHSRDLHLESDATMDEPKGHQKSAFTCQPQFSKSGLQKIHAQTADEWKASSTR